MQIANGNHDHYRSDVRYFVLDYYCSTAERAECCQQVRYATPTAATTRGSRVGEFFSKRTCSVSGFSLETPPRFRINFDFFDFVRRPPDEKGFGFRANNTPRTSTYNALRFTLRHVHKYIFIILDAFSFCTLQTHAAKKP